jgi:hypothetical protein
VALSARDRLELTNLLLVSMDDVALQLVEQSVHLEAAAQLEAGVELLTLIAPPAVHLNAKEIHLLVDQLLLLDQSLPMDAVDLLLEELYAPLDSAALLEVGVAPLMLIALRAVLLSARELLLETVEPTLELLLSPFKVMEDRPSLWSRFDERTSRTPPNLISLQLKPTTP